MNTKETEKLRFEDIVPGMKDNAATLGDIERAMKNLDQDPTFADDLEAVNAADEPLINPWA